MMARISKKYLYLYRNNAVTDIFIACHDNLTGLSEALNSIFPKTKNQLRIVHQIRNSCKFVPYKDRKAVCADLKKFTEQLILTTPNLQERISEKIGIKTGRN